MGDTFNMSGDFRGAILNIKSTLTNVQQSVGDIHSDDDGAKNELKQLIEQLNQSLQKAPPETKEQVEAVAETTKTLVDQAREEKPNKTMIKINAEGLKQAAQNLAGVMPSVLPIVSQIVMSVMKMTGAGG